MKFIYITNSRYVNPIRISAPLDDLNILFKRYLTSLMFKIWTINFDTKIFVN